MTYVVLLNWNGYRDTIECLESLLPVLGSDDGVIVCDNASADGSVVHIMEWAAAHHPEWRPQVLDRSAAEQTTLPEPRTLYLVRNGANLGFAGGNNVGVRLALKDPACTYVWLLNNDTMVDAATLPAAIARMEQDPGLGICGSTLVYAHDRRTVQAQGGAVYSPSTGRSRHIGAFASLDSRLISSPQVEREMSYVVGASMLVRRELLESIGLMNEDYFLYCEELDWALRARGRYRLGYAADSIVFHKEGASIGTSASGGSPLSCYYLFRNRIRISAKFFPLRLPSVVAFAVVDAAKLAARGRWKNALAALSGLLQLPLIKPVAGQLP